MTPLYVSHEEWRQWTRDRLQRAWQTRRGWERKRQRDLARAQAPTRVDVECQLHALRHHNEVLSREVEVLRERLGFEEDVLRAVLEEFRLYRERNPERQWLRVA